jgi:hypothetical protein
LEDDCLGAEVLQDTRSFVRIQKKERGYHVVIERYLEGSWGNVIHVVYPVKEKNERNKKESKNQCVG